MAIYKRVTSGLFILLLFAGTLSAASVEGVWEGVYRVVSAGTVPNSSPMVLILEKKDGKLTGSGGPSEEQLKPFDSIALKGDMLTLRQEQQGGGRVLVVELKVDGDRMVGRMNHEGAPDSQASQVYLNRKK